MDTRESEIYLAVVIAVLLVGFILSYLFILLIRQHIKTIQLQKSNAFAEITTMEKERARIAADLHDELGPVLSVIKFRILNEISNQPNSENELVKASNQLDEVIEKVRQISNNLLPSILLNKGVIVAIETFIHQLEPLYRLHIDFEYPPFLSINEDQGIQIYRIVQEVINNCIKHANATKLLILFKLDKNRLTLICEDNGIGLMNAEISNHSTGRGINSMKYRTEMMAGFFKIDAEPGIGTILTFEIPLK